MTVGELREQLEELDDDLRVVFKPSNSMYVESIGNVAEEETTITSFYGDDYEAVIIFGGSQCGAV